MAVSLLQLLRNTVASRTGHGANENVRRPSDFLPILAETAIATFSSAPPRSQRHVARCKATSGPAQPLRPANLVHPAALARPSTGTRKPRTPVRGSRTNRFNRSNWLNLRVSRPNLPGPWQAAVPRGRSPQTRLRRDRGDRCTQSKPSKRGELELVDRTPDRVGLV